MGVYTIMFNTNGGTTYELLTEQTEIPDLSEYTPTKALSYFAGWYYEADFQTKANQGDPLTEDITLYARWLNTAELLALLQEEKDKLIPTKLAKDFTAFGVTGILDESIELSQAEYDALGENWVPGITYIIIEEPEEEE